ncbi:MAG: tetratricopeptide repeat protein [Rhodospirillaceae bacterium]
MQRALVLHTQGKVADAEVLYDKILRINPAQGDALNLKGVIAAGRGQHAQALGFYDRSLAAQPAFPDTHFNRANTLSALNRDVDALAAYAKALELRPDYAAAYLNAGRTLHKLGRPEHAAAMFRAMAAACPTDPRGPYNLGICLTELLPKAKTAERKALTAEARAAFETALALDPKSAATYYAFASLHSENGEHRRAVELVRIALEFKPEWSDAWNNLGNHYEGLGEREAAIAAFDRALQLNPRNMGAVVNRGLTQLALGQMANGWDGYAHRFDDPRFPFTPRDWPWPAWQGEDLAGKRILLWSDQGIGDEVLYASMLSEVAARAATCVVECSARLVPLYRGSFPGLEIVPNQPAAQAELRRRPFDFQCSVLDLGRWLRRAWSGFPNRPRHLVADAQAAAGFRAKYQAISPGAKLVGLSWHSANPRTGQQKSLPLDHFAPLLTLPKFTFVNIQYGHVNNELDVISAKYGVKIVADSDVDSLRDLDTYAAQLAALDMVVTVSNSAAHLAGALGIPTGLFIPNHHKRLWYWFDQGTFSPWYRSVRIFRDSAEASMDGLKRFLLGATAV